MRTVAMEQETNPWESQAARFDLAAQKLNLDEGLWKPDAAGVADANELGLHEIATRRRL